MVVVTLVAQMHEEPMEVLRLFLLYLQQAAAQVDHMMDPYNLELLVDLVAVEVKLTLLLIQTGRQVTLPQLALLKVILVGMVQNHLIKEQAAVAVLQRQVVQLYLLHPILQLEVLEVLVQLHILQEVQ